MAVATAAIIGSVVALGSAGASFAQAAKQRNAQTAAQDAANKAMEEARKKLDVNFYASQAINKEPYELASEALTSQGAQSIQAAQEQERGAAATAGRVQMAMNEGQGQIRTAMSNEMTDLENKKLAEDSRLRDMGVQLDQAEAAGAQQAAADAAQAAAAATEQGFASATSALQQGLQGADLYGKSSSAKQFEGLQNDYNAAVAKGGLAPQYYDANGKALPFQQAIAKSGNNFGFDLSGVNTMNPFIFKDYFTGQSASDIKAIRGGVDFFGKTTPVGAGVGVGLGATPMAAAPVVTPYDQDINPFGFPKKR